MVTMTLFYSLASDNILAPYIQPASDNILVLYRSNLNMKMYTALANKTSAERETRKFINEGQSRSLTGLALSILASRVQSEGRAVARRPTLVDSRGFRKVVQHLTPHNFCPLPFPSYPLLNPSFLPFFFSNFHTEYLIPCKLNTWHSRATALGGPPLNSKSLL